MTENLPDGEATTTGGCLCGKVRYELVGAPVATALCHCENCRRQSGSNYSFNLVLPSDAYRQTGEARVFMDKGDSGGTVARHFCGECGSPLVSLVETMPGITVVKGGTLDEPARWTPTIMSYAHRALPWSADISQLKPV